VFLFHRLRGEFGIDAGTAEKQETRYPGHPGVVNDVILNHQVVMDELPLVTAVGDDAADPGSGKKNVFRPLLTKKRFNLALATKIKFGSGSEQQVTVPGSLQRPYDRRTNHAAVACNKNFGIILHLCIFSGYS
jgi:hypothetical protein